MPVQSLEKWERPSRQPVSSPRGIFSRRAFVIGGTAAMAVEAAFEMYRTLGVSGLTVLEAVVLVLFVPLFAWIAFSFTSALGGCLAMLTRDGRRLGIGAEEALPPLSSRTALLMPTYNESPARVMAGLQAIYGAIPPTPISGSPRRQHSWSCASVPARMTGSSIGDAPRTRSARQAISRIGSGASAPAIPRWWCSTPTVS
jgi:membrane glycosyltransferase